MIPQVSIVCVNFNEKRITLEFLDSLQAQHIAAIEVIVVDNSTFREEKLQPEDHPLHLQVVYCENKGYAAALNTGIEQTTAPILLLVNNDVILENNSLTCLLDFLQKHPEADAASPMIFRTDEEKCDYAGYSPINRFTGRNHALTSRPAGKLRKTPYLHGACMILRRRVLNAGIKLPEIYFLYYEELEWSHSLRKAGYNLVVPPNCRIRHRKSVSTSRNKALQHYYLTRNRILFMRRTVSGMNFTIFLLYILIISTPYNILRLLVKGKISLINAHVRAIVWNMNYKNTTC